MGPVVTVLPPRERYGAGCAGAISLLVARLAMSDVVLGSAFAGVPFAAGRFVPVLPSRWGFGQGRRYARGCLAILRGLRPGLVEVHNRPELALYLAKCLRGVRVMLVLHNDPLGMRRARSVAERRVLLGCMGVVGVSGWVRRRFLEGIEGEVGVLPNCIDLAAVPEGGGERAREIVFAGRVVADKGADVFVEACGAVLPRHDGWRAVMIGADRFGVDSPVTPFLEGLVPKARAAGVEMVGYRPHEAVLEAMARGAIVVMPSRWPEPFGLTALEAMACGAALVVSARGALPDVVGDAAVLVDPDEPGAVARAIEGLMGDEGRRVALGRAGRARAALFDVGVARTRLGALRAGMVSP